MKLFKRIKYAFFRCAAHRRELARAAAQHQLDLSFVAALGSRALEEIATLERRRVNAAFELEQEILPLEQEMRALEARIEVLSDAILRETKLARSHDNGLRVQQAVAHDRYEQNKRRFNNIEAAHEN
jgi:hypothetical protein